MVSSTSLQYLYHFRMPFQWLSEHGALYLHLTVLQKTGQGSHLVGIILELHFKAQKRCLGGSVANSLLSYTAILSWRKPLLAKSGFTEKWSFKATAGDSRKPMKTSFMNPPSLLCRKAKVRSWGGSCPWPFYPILRTLHCTTLPKHAKTPHQARDHDDASWTNAVWSSDNWGWKYLRKHGYEWVRTKLLRGCPACYILRSFTQPHVAVRPCLTSLSQQIF